MAKPSKTRNTCILQPPETQTETPVQSVDNVIAEAVSESLSSFGPAFKQAVCGQLEQTYRIKQTEIPERINEFTNAIEAMFGIGAKIIELRIIEAIHNKMPAFVHFPKQGDLLFANYIDELRYF
jgi:hypothetical protein